MVKKFMLPLLITVALIGAACGRKETVTSVSSNAAAAGTVEAPLSGTADLTIEDFAYAPPSLVVKKGTVVTITNKDIAGHTVTADDGSFDSKTINRGKSAALTMNTVGIFTVHCTPHPQITGTITVVD